MKAGRTIGGSIHNRECGTGCAHILELVAAMYSHALSSLVDYGDVYGLLQVNLRTLILCMCPMGSRHNSVPRQQEVKLKCDDLRLSKLTKIKTVFTLAYPQRSRLEEVVEGG